MLYVFVLTRFPPHKSRKLRKLACCATPSSSLKNAVGLILDSLIT